MQRIHKKTGRFIILAIMLFVNLSFHDAWGQEGDGSPGDDGQERVELNVDAANYPSADLAEFVIDAQTWYPCAEKDNGSRGAAGTHTFRLKKGRYYTLDLNPLEAIWPDDGTVSLGWNAWTDDPIQDPILIDGGTSVSGFSGNLQRIWYYITVPDVKVVSADVTQDEIQLTLKPEGAEGVLTLELVGNNHTHQIRSEARTGSGSPMIETFDIPNLAEGEYTQLRATWRVGVVSVQDEFDYHIQVLGMYNHTRYNTPTESLCSGTDTSFSYTIGDCQAVQQCNWIEGTGLSDWLAEVAQNGSGYSISGEYFSLEWFCTNSSATYRLRRVPDPCPQCDGTLIENVSVARNEDNEDLPCGARVYVHEVGIVTVQDAGGELTMRQLDHYAGTSGCNGTAGTIGERMTIRLHYLEN